MDVNDFQTIGECSQGFIWRVASENKVVVNVGKVALYFETDEFFEFAAMIGESAKNLADLLPGNKKPKTDSEQPSSGSKIASISKFRAQKEDNDE